MNKEIAEKTLLAQESFFCEGCGEGFRYEETMRTHQKNCIDFKYGKL